MHPYEVVCSRSVALPYPTLACRRRYIGCVMHNTGFWTICDIYVPNSQVGTARTTTPWHVGSMGAPVRGTQPSAGRPTVDRADCGCACVRRGPCATSLATCSGALTNMALPLSPNMALPLSPNSTGPRVHLHLCRPGGHVARRVSAPLPFIFDCIPKGCLPSLTASYPYAHHACCHYRSVQANPMRTTRTATYTNYPDSRPPTNLASSLPTAQPRRQVAGSKLCAVVPGATGRRGRGRGGRGGRRRRGAPRLRTLGKCSQGTVHLACPGPLLRVHGMVCLDPLARPHSRPKGVGAAP